MFSIINPHRNLTRRTPVHMHNFQCFDDALVFPVTLLSLFLFYSNIVKCTGALLIVWTRDKIKTTVSRAGRKRMKRKSGRG